MSDQITRSRSGLFYALAAYASWGFLPIYFKLLQSVRPSEIVAQRILWSLILLGGLITVGRRWPAIRAALRNPAALRILAVTALLIGANWLIYVFAILEHHVLASSIGYFLNPLVNVALGMIFLRERLTRAQGVAVGLAAIGVAVLASGAGQTLWISLALAFTFAAYGLLRKVAPVEALEGLAIETLLLAPVALGWILWLSQKDALAFGDTGVTSLLLVLGGVVTAVPLLCFSAAARRMRYSTLGLIQYVAPTIQFLLAVFAYGEPLSRTHAICLGFIWTGLVIYAASSVIEARRQAVAEPV